jgi:hypothetical protein
MAQLCACGRSLGGYGGETASKHRRRSCAQASGRGEAETESTARERSPDRSAAERTAN